MVPRLAAAERDKTGGRDPAGHAGLLVAASKHRKPHRKREWRPCSPSHPMAWRRKDQRSPRCGGRPALGLPSSHRSVAKRTRSDGHRLAWASGRADACRRQPNPAVAPGPLRSAEVRRVPTMPSAAAPQLLGVARPVGGRGGRFGRSRNARRTTLLPNASAFSVTRSADSRHCPWRALGLASRVRPPPAAAVSEGTRSVQVV